MQLARDGGEPLYKQIEARLSYEIVTGRRTGGTRLPSLRDAAQEWGVNLHTVRRAYRELVAQGLVRTGAAGTRVARLGPGMESLDSLEAFLRDMSRQALDRYGVSPVSLARALQKLADREGVAFSCAVAECSRALSRGLAHDLNRRFALRAEAVDLLRTEELPPGPIVGTYFHLEELRKLMKGREEELSLVRIRPRASFMARLARDARAGEIRRLILMDRLPGSANDLTDQFQTALGPNIPIEVRILRDPMLAFPAPAPKTVVVATPQTWDRLTVEVRARRDVRELRYEIEPEDLDRLEQSLGWHRW